MPKEELVWHRDYYSRTVTVLESGPQWYFQVDRSIPVGMNEGGEFVIDAKTWHRVLKGAGKLVLERQVEGKVNEIIMWFNNDNNMDACY